MSGTTIRHNQNRNKGRKECHISEYVTTYFSSLNHDNINLLAKIYNCCGCMKSEGEGETQRERERERERKRPTITGLLKQQQQQEQHR